MPICAAKIIRPVRVGELFRSKKPVCPGEIEMHLDQPGGVFGVIANLCMDFKFQDMCALFRRMWLLLCNHSRLVSSDVVPLLCSRDV